MPKSTEFDYMTKIKTQLIAQHLAQEFSKFKFFLIKLYSHLKFLKFQKIFKTIQLPWNRSRPTNISLGIDTINHSFLLSDMH